MRLGRWVRTARHLGLWQALAWLARPARRWRLGDLSGAAPPRRPRREGVAPVAGCARERQWLDRQTFRAHGETDPARGTRLWHYVRHYHDDLGYSRDVALEAGVAGDWIAANPVGRGPGWEPYPLSRRVVNWVRWEVRNPGASSPAMIASLAAQSRALARQIEHDLQANHLWANAKALLVAGAFFGGREGEAWRRRGEQLFRRECGRQILADGGHIERSPMYHALCLEDLLDLIELARHWPEALEGCVAEWRAAASSMLGWLHAMTHTDGAPAGFGDTAPGSTPRVEHLGRYAARLGLVVPRVAGPGLTVLDPSRYVRLEAGELTLWFDRGAAAPNYQPGHSHAAILAFELDWDGERVFAHPGISTYEPGLARSYERSTGAHNTLRLDGRDQSELWGAFRLGRRAAAGESREGQNAAALWAEGAHDGYQPVRHRRRVVLDREGSSLTVTDWLELPEGHERPEHSAWHSVELFFHLAPGWRARRAGDSELELQRADGSGGRRIRFAFPDGLAAWIESSWSHPDFGARVAAERIRLAGPVRVIRDGVHFECTFSFSSSCHENSLLRRQLSARTECPSLARV